MNSTKVSIKHRTSNDGKPVLCEYQPLQGFYDLRNWDIPKKDFLKLWGIQRYLFQCEQNRQIGNENRNKKKRGRDGIFK